MNAANVTNPELTKEVNSLIRGFQIRGEDSNIFELKYDLLSMAFCELIASPTFLQMSPERKKDLFRKFESLNTILEEIDEFVEKYPVWLNIEEVVLKQEEAKKIA